MQNIRIYSFYLLSFLGTMHRTPRVAKERFDQGKTCTRKTCHKILILFVPVTYLILILEKPFLFRF